MNRHTGMAAMDALWVVSLAWSRAGIAGTGS